MLSTCKKGTLSWSYAKDNNGANGLLTKTGGWLFHDNHFILMYYQDSCLDGCDFTTTKCDSARKHTGFKQADCLSHLDH